MNVESGEEKVTQAPNENDLGGVWIEFKDLYRQVIK